MLVGEPALLRPSPTYPVVTIELVKGTNLTDAVPSHLVRNGFPQQAKALAKLFQTLISSQLVTLQLELCLLSSMPRKLDLTDETFPRSILRLVPTALAQLLV